MSTPGQPPVKRALIYSRCSTEESRQDTENQSLQLRRYCEAFGWAFDEVAEYDSGFKGTQPKLQAVLERIRRKDYDVLVVYSLDRFSRQHPSKVNRLLDTLVDQYGCRFISLQEGVDSANELVWHAIRPLFTYFANVFSRNLSEKIRLGIQTKKAKGMYRGGRPRKAVDVQRLRQIRLAHPDYGWRRLSHAFNEGLPSKDQVSLSFLRKVCKTLSFSQANGYHTDGPQNSGHGSAQLPGSLGRVS